MKKKLYLITTLTLLITLFAPTVVFANNTPSFTEHSSIISNEIIPRANDIGYQYKTVKGVLYKRLYNFTLRKPLSSWKKVN